MFKTKISKTLKQTKIFLGLIKKYKINNTQHIKIPVENEIGLNMNLFNKYYVGLLSVVYLIDFLEKSNLTTTEKIFYNYYAKLSNTKKTSLNVNINLLKTYIVNNFIVFCKPTKQLFCVFHHNKPVFIFTGGLMKFILNENKKSSKKMYKVAISLIKLAAILSNNKRYFNTFYLRLNNIGNLKINVLKTFNNTNLVKMLTYILFKVRIDYTSQKFKTRRSIKKYVKKRFKLNN